MNTLSRNLAPVLDLLTDPCELLSSKQALESLREIQKTGKWSGSPTNLSPDERAYLQAETMIRGSVYTLKDDDLRGVSEWMKSFTAAMGFLFTSPSQALHQIFWLEERTSSFRVLRRLEFWKMHLYLLMGQCEDGLPIRDKLLGKIEENSIWKAEELTLLAISFYSTSQSKLAVKLHRQAQEYMTLEPEAYFSMLGSSLAERAALKAGDPASFQYFSQVLAGGLRSRPDARYALRQHGYRAILLTQLGESGEALRHWEDGDKLLPQVDHGLPSLERLQFLTLRTLASSLHGQRDEAKKFESMANHELNLAGDFEVHRAELDLCRLLGPIASPGWRSTNLIQARDLALSALEECKIRMTKAEPASVKKCYFDGVYFCSKILGQMAPIECTGNLPLPEKDHWNTLTLTILDYYQDAHEFASKVDYFRLIPLFMSELENHGLGEPGILESLKQTLGFEPLLTNGRYQLPVKMNAIEERSETSRLLKFASDLGELAKKADHSVQEKAIFETARSIAHDLKRPFHAIHAASRVLAAAARRKLPHESSFDATFADFSTFRASLKRAESQAFSIVDELVNLGKPVKLTKCKVRLEDILNGCLEEMKSRDLDGVEFRLTESTDAIVSCDAPKIERVVLNIVENAAQAILEKGGIVSVSSAVVAFDRIEIGISNPSVIPKEVLPRIFERFFTDKLNGTGLGLAISKDFIEAHGGSISVSSTDGEGTKFVISLPMN